MIGIITITAMIAFSIGYIVALFLKGWADEDEK
jgi:hypothetical protein